MPPFYSKSTLVFIMLMYFAVACITAYMLTRNNYSKDQTTNWILLGGLTSESVTFRVRKSSGATRLVVGKNFSHFLYDENLDSNNNNSTSTDELVTAMTVSGLESNTQYYYSTRDDKEKIYREGSFRTAPVEGNRTRFKFATAGCSQSGSNHNVFSVVRNENPLFFLHLGDLHYENINADNVERRVEALDRVMNSPTQRELFSIPLSYIWDDHDWLGNNALGYGEGREAALESYRTAFPYYEPLPSNNSAVYHAFTIGTIRFVISDLRSEVTETEMYSREQKEWLFNELSQAGNYDFVIWATSKPWINQDIQEGEDSWWGYGTDRQALSDHISSIVPNNLLAVASDAHMVAFDDGSNTYYGTSTDGTAKSFPILQTGPLDRVASFKGGPFSDGCYGYSYERNHQYSVIEFLEQDGEVCLEIKTYRIEGPTTKQEIFTKKLCGDIFTESNPGQGSCERSGWFSDDNKALVIASGCFLGVSLLETCFLGYSVLHAILTSVIILVLFAGTLSVGFFIPYASGIAQYDAFKTGLIGMVEILNVVIYLGLWIGHARGEKARMEE
jgi:hypothetical protein